eukprot:752594-Hanusia_phi.AAC.10
MASDGDHVAVGGGGRRGHERGDVVRSQGDEDSKIFRVSSAPQNNSVAWQPALDFSRESPDDMSSRPRRNSLNVKKFRRAELEVAERIGKGAYGGVWQATVLDTKEEVVVKVVWPDADLDPEDAKTESPGKLRREAFKVRETRIRCLTD